MEQMNPDCILNTCITLEHVIPRETAQFFLPLYLKHPAILKLRNAGIGMAGVSRATPGFRLRRIPGFRFALFTCSGSGKVTAGAQTHEQSAGSFCILPAGKEQFYRQTGSAPWRFCWFHLTPDTPLPPAGLPQPFFGRRTPPVQLEAAMKGLALESIHVIRNLAADTSDERPPWHFYCDSMDLAAALCAFGLKPDRSPYGCEALIASYTDQILELLARSFHLPESVQTEPPPDDPFENLWRQVSGSLEKKWTLEMMAAEVYMSVSTLLRQAKRRYDATPMQVLYHLRLKRANTLLVSTTLPVSVIALRCGYDNFAAFSTAFKKEYGISPRTCRREGVGR